MNLSDKQLKVQQRADKTLSLGCIVEQGKVYYNPKTEKETICSERIRVIGNDKIEDNYIVDNNGISVEKILKVIGHPITRGRLCYLYVSSQGDSTEGTEEGEAMFKYADEYYDIYNQTILTRPEEFIDIVLAFLETLPKE